MSTRRNRFSGSLSLRAGCGWWLMCNCNHFWIVSFSRDRLLRQEYGRVLLQSPASPFSLLPFIRDALNSRDVITTSFQDDCCVEDRNQVVSFYSRIRPDGLDSTQISVGCETLSLFTCALRHSLKARTWTRTPSECIHQERRPGKEE